MILMSALLTVRAGLAHESPAVAATSPPAATSSSTTEAPPLPTLEELEVLDGTDPRFARPIVRRVARTAPDKERRARALMILAQRDPSKATARICARALRLDPELSVRRAGAECIGRMSEEHSNAQTSVLVAALDDESLDVVTMAGWALANVGGREALGPVAAKVRHPDRRVGRLFVDFSERLRGRHALRYDDRTSSAEQLVPPPGRLAAQLRGLEVTAATGWLSLYGGMSGWLHGGMLVAAYGGPIWQNLSPLSAMGGAVVGLIGGGSYAFFRADDLRLAHTVVQLGTFGTLVGYGAGLLSDVAPQNGVNMALFGMAGSAVGTGIGIALAETRPPTSGALALGATVAFGSAVSFGGLAYSSSYSNEGAFALAMLAGGGLGALTTLVAAPAEIGLLPCIGATVGGATFAAIAGVLVGGVESFQLGLDALRPFTEGSGWAIAAGYATGAVVGGLSAALLPAEWDPLLAGRLTLTPPSFAAVPSLKDPRSPIPVAVLGGSF
jgi:hypothetical protein